MNTTPEYRYQFANGTFEIHSVTTAYRVRIEWADGHETWIGDYPTRRIAARNAEDFMLANLPAAEAPAITTCAALCGTDETDGCNPDRCHCDCHAADTAVRDEDGYIEHCANCDSELRRTDTGGLICDACGVTAPVPVDPDRPRRHAANRIYSVENASSTVTVVVRRDRTTSARAWVEGESRPWKSYERYLTGALLRQARRLPEYTIVRQFA